jgi:type IV pilus assembly protein PilC
VADEPLFAEILPDLPRLSAAEADELVRRVGELAGARTDLPRGLRTSADACSQPRLARALRLVADQIERGRALPEILQQASHCLPPHLAGLVAAAVSSGDCGGVLSELSDLRARQDEAWRETWSVIAYPLGLLVLTILTFVAVTNLIVPTTQQFVREMDLPQEVQATSLMWFVEVGQFLLGSWLIAMGAILLVVRFLGPYSLWCRLRMAVPLIGKTFLWSGLVELLELVRIQVAQGIPLPQAWRLAAGGIRDAHLSQVALRIARGCEQGRPLAAVLNEEPATFPAAILPFIALAERTGDLPGCLAAANEVIDDRRRARTHAIGRIAPMVLFLIITTLAISLPTTVISPMFQLLQGLSGGGRRRGAAAAPAPIDSIFSSGPINLTLLLPLAVALSISRRLLYSDRRPGTSSWLYALLWEVEAWAWTIGVIGYLLLGPIILAIIPLFAAVYVLISSYFTLYGAERESLLSLLGHAAQRGLPLAAAAVARTREHEDRLGRKSQRLAEGLAQGQTLPEALHSARIRMPAEQRSALEAACATEDLGPSLLASLARQRTNRRALSVIAAAIVYFEWTVLVMLGVLSFVMLNIVPVFAKMFYEFNLDLPKSTILLVNISRFIYAKFPLIALALMFVVGGFAVSVNDLAFRVAAVPLPFLHRFRRRQYGAWLLHALATLVRGKRPLPQAVFLMAERFPIAAVRRRLLVVARQIEGGQEWTETLRQAGYISRYDAAFLLAAQRNGHLAWALDEAATNSERRRLLRARWWANLVFPLAIVILGGVTAFVFIALFEPLIEMITRLSEANHGFTPTK